MIRIPPESPTSPPVPLSHPYRVGGTWDSREGLSRGTPVGQRGTVGQHPHPQPKSHDFHAPRRQAGNRRKLPELDSQTNHERIQTMTTNQTDTRTAAQATDHPELYAKTVWGRMKVSQNTEMVEPTIIRARNRIAEEWGLVRQIEADTLLAARADIRADFDHVEAYESRKGWIYLLCSNDRRSPPPVLGMKPIPAVYARGMRSFAARYATRRELLARLEAFASGGGKEKFGAARHLFREPPTPRRSRLRGRGKATT